MATARQGRPPNYTDEQLSTAIGMSETAGKEPTPEVVRDLLNQLFGISMGTNLQSLGIAIDRVRSEREAKREQALVDALPTDVRDALRGLVGTLVSRISVKVGELHERVLAELKKRVEALELEKNALHRQCDEHVAQHERDQQRIAQLERERERLNARDAKRERREARLIKERDHLRRKVERLERDADVAARVDDLAARLLPTEANQRREV